MSNLAQPRVKTPLVEGARWIGRVSKPILGHIGQNQLNKAQKPVFIPIPQHKNGPFQPLGGHFWPDLGPMTHIWRCLGDLDGFQPKQYPSRSEIVWNGQKTGFLPVFGHFGKVSNPYRPFFHFNSIGFMGVFGKVMDSAIIPEKMSSRCACLGRFIHRWVKLVRFME